MSKNISDTKYAELSRTQASKEDINNYYIWISKLRVASVNIAETIFDVDGGQQLFNFISRKNKLR